MKTYQTTLRHLKASQNAIVFVSSLCLMSLVGCNSIKKTVFGQNDKKEVPITSSPYAQGFSGHSIGNFVLTRQVVFPSSKIEIRYAVWTPTGCGNYISMDQYSTDPALFGPYAIVNVNGETINVDFRLNSGQDVCWNITSIPDVASSSDLY